MPADETRIDWHSAYYEALQAELSDYLSSLTFEREHPLNAEPFRIDTLIIKKKPGAVIRKNFAEEFLTHNIFEFKNPYETLSITDYIKVIGYGCLYQSVASVPYNDITLNIVCTRKPIKLFNDIISRRQYKITEKFVYTRLLVSVIRPAGIAP